MALVRTKKIFWRQMRNSAQRDDSIWAGYQRPQMNIYMIYYLQYGDGPDRQVVKLKDERFGHLPWKPFSAKVAICGCLLVNGPLQIQFPSEETVEKKLSCGNHTNRSYLFMVSIMQDYINACFFCCLVLNLATLEENKTSTALAPIHVYRTCVGKKSACLAPSTGACKFDKSQLYIIYGILKRHYSKWDIYLTMTPGRRSKFLLTIWSNSDSVFLEEP